MFKIYNSIAFHGITVNLTKEKTTETQQNVDSFPHATNATMDPHRTDATFIVIGFGIVKLLRGVLKELGVRDNF